MAISNLGCTPAVFVSSTCYDLKQIRIDMKDFIENQLGFNAILSEYDSFPINPNIGTVENCIRIVQERADIFVLIIGGRYGNVTDSGKSVTNLEYIYARAKGVPIYVFVDKEILNLLPVWKLNQTMDFSNVVDSNKLFEFVESLRCNENIWMFGFESAQDIMKTLKKQIGFLIHDLLNLHNKLHFQKSKSKIFQLSPEAFRILLEKPFGWEYLLFGEVMNDSIAQLADSKRDLIYGISFGKVESLTEPNEIFNWLISKCNQIQLIIGTLNNIFNKAIPAAIGDFGISGNVEEIIYVAQRIGSVYKEIIEWGLDVKLVYVDEEWQGVINALSKLWVTPIQDLDTFCDNYIKAMNEMKLVTYDTGENYKIELSLELNAPDLTEFYYEMNILRSKYGLQELC